MTKQAIHQNLLGKKLLEDPKMQWNDRGTFKYFALKGPELTITAVWLDDGAVKVLGTDSNGKSADLWVNMFLIKQE